MRFTEYLFGGDGTLPESDEDKVHYHNYFLTESVLGAGIAFGAAAGIGGLIIPSTLLLVDLGVRLRRNAYEGSPTSGLVGMINKNSTKAD